MTTLELRHARDWAEVRRAAVGAGRAFPNRTPEEEYFYAYTLRAPGLSLDNVYLAVLEGTVVSQVLVHERTVRVGQFPARMGAIGAVYTLPEHRGNGYAGRLLEYVRSALDEKGFAYSMLHTGSGIQALYRGHGWEEVFYPRYVVDAPPSGEGPTGRFRAFDRERDLAAVAACYRTEHGDSEGAMYRPRHYWLDWILDPEKEVLGDGRIRVYEEAGAVTGYLASHPAGTDDTDDDGRECLEVAYRGDDRRSFLLACWDALAGAGSVTWHPPLLDAVRSAVDGGVERERCEGTMVQLHDAALVSRLAGEPVETTGALVERLDAAGFLALPLDAF
jgi:GNAT superfamily N-acetyltransferase